MAPLEFHLGRLRHTTACAIALLTIVVASVVGQGTPPPAVAPRVQIEKLLREGEEASRRGELGLAVKASKSACRLADQVLPGDDPLRMRATRDYLRLQTEDFVKRRDFRSAVKHASMLRQFEADAGDAKASLKWAEYCNEIADRWLPPGDPDRVIALVDLAWLKVGAALDQGNHAAAVTWADRAAAAVETTLPPGHLARLRAWNLQATVEHGQARRQSGEALCRRILVETQAAGGEPRKVAIRLEALMMLAGMNLTRGEPVGPEFVDALASTRKSSPDQRTFAALLQNVAQAGVWKPLVERARDEAAGRVGIEGAAGRLEADIDRFQDALRRAGIVDALSGLGLLGLAEFHWDQRRLDVLDATLRRIGTSIGDPSVLPSFAGYYWNYLGLLEAERANYGLARSHFETALGIWRKAGLPHEALALGGIGQLLLRQGDYHAAMERLRDSVALHERSGLLRGKVSHALALRNLSDSIAGQGEAEDATRLRKEALAIAESARPVAPYAVYLCRNSLGGGAYQEGRFAEARAEFEKSRDVALASFGAGHFHVAEADVNLGWIDLAQDRTAEAVARFEAALAIIRRRLGEDHPRYAEVLGYMARARIGRGEPGEARRLLSTGLDHRQRYIDRLLRSALSERDRLSLVQEMRVHPESRAWPGVFDTYLELATVLDIPVEEQYRRILIWKGILSRRFPPSSGGEAGEGEQIRMLERRRKEVATRLRDAIFLDRSGELARELEAEEEDLERRVRAIAPHLSVDRSARLGVTPLKVSGALPLDAAMLDVVQIRLHRPRREGQPLEEDQAAYVAILTRGGRPPIRVELGAASALDLQIRRLVSGIPGREDVREAGALLSAAIRAPLLPHLVGVETLIVAPDGLLHRLPMCALPGDGPGTYWINELAFASVPSAQSFLDRRQGGGRPATRGALVVGGVDYGVPKIETPAERRSARNRLFKEPWQPLSETRAEAEQVAISLREAGDLGPVELLTGVGATRARIRDGLPRHRLVHFATHGSFSEDREPDSSFGIYGASAGFDSFLVLSKANSGGIDCLLTAGEIESMDLRGVELVVLSACESGLGHIRAGQGMIGLPGALDRAGAAAVISTLWSVGDESTRAFMGRYYQHFLKLGRRRGPGHALRETQRDMLRGDIKAINGTLLNEKSQWASFVLDGDPFPPPVATTPMPTH